VPLNLDYIGFQETKKEEFTNSFLKNLLGNRNFVWNFLPAVGTSGGILVGINADLLEVLAWEIKTFSVSAVVKNRRNDYICRITTVYGSAYEDKKQEFISELHELFLNWEGPALIGGDFNLVRFLEDKNNGNIDFKWANKFKAWIEMWALMEIGVTGRNYTWGNNQENPVMCKLDRIFCSTSFDNSFPLASARVLSRSGSDHTPLFGILGTLESQRKGVLSWKSGGWQSLNLPAWSTELGA
jgi:hypothetical protein